MKKFFALIMFCSFLSLSCFSDGGESGDTVTYAVTYNGNGNTSGSVPVDSANYEAGAAVTVPGNTGNLVKTGYTFAGWCVNYSGIGTTYTQGQTFTMESANVILYAVWTTNPTYTVTYNSNGDTGGSVPVDSTNYEAGAAVTVPGNTGSLVKLQDGISLFFVGWNTQLDGNGTTYTASQTFTMGSAAVTLYAKWSALRATGPAGGLIFYDKGSYSGSPSWRYLEAAPSDQSISAVWGTDNYTITGADGTAIGTGYQNTSNIVAGDPLSNTAADICSELVLGGYSDWFLPSKDELNQIYVNLRAYGVGGFASAYYWSSSENNATTAWLQGSLFKGAQYYANKYNTYYVRAVRAF